VREVAGPETGAVAMRQQVDRRRGAIGEDHLVG
jgi:hypothetical protein